MDHNKEIRKQSILYWGETHHPGHRWKFLELWVDFWVNFKVIVQQWAAIADGISFFLLFKIQIFEHVRWLIQFNSDFIQDFWSTVGERKRQRGKKRWQSQKQAQLTHFHTASSATGSTDQRRTRLSSDRRGPGHRCHQVKRFFMINYIKGFSDILEWCPLYKSKSPSELRCPHL